MKKTTFSVEHGLETLIDELMKEVPNQNLVRKLMLLNGIPYSKDPIAQMGQVLTVMNEKPLVNSRVKIKKSEKEL